MTKEQINIAIAEEQGWRHREGGMWYCPDGSTVPETLIPNYTSDLNAIHEAEKSITDPRKMLDYFNHLSRYNDPDARSIQDSFNIITATTAQRAEAYLRTIGKWKDE